MFRGRPSLRVLKLMEEDTLKQYRFASRSDNQEPRKEQLHFFELARELAQEMVALNEAIIHELKREEYEQAAKSYH